MKTLQLRLEEKIMPEPNTGCWLWIAGLSKSGYGRVIFEGSNRLAHRVVFELIKHKIPKGLHACHRCDTPSCVNPDHIFLGTDYDNAQDMVKKGRSLIRPGDLNPNAKLTSKEVIKIREMISKGHLQKWVAKKMNVSTCTISSIWLNKTWKNI